MQLPLANLFGIDNWIVIAVFGLLLFGRRVPEVARSLGKGIVEFKKGLAGIEDDIQQNVNNPTALSNRNAPQAALPTGYKFDPYTGKPLTPEPAAQPPMRFDPYTGKPIEQTSGSSNG